MELPTQNLPAPNRDVHKILNAAVTPRPIAWVSTLGAGDAPTLAPYSFFNAICSYPP